MVLKCIVSILFFRSSKNNFWLIGNAIKQLKPGCTGHFNVKEKEINSIAIEKFKSRFNVGELPLYRYAAAFFTATHQVISSHLQIFNYYAIQCHDINSVSLLHSS